MIGNVIRIVSWVRCSGFFRGFPSSDRGSSWPRVEELSRIWIAPLIVSRSLYRLYCYSSSLICQTNIWILFRAALVVVDYLIIFSCRLPCREFGFLVKLLLYLAEEINSQSYMYWFVASIFILSAAAREQVPTSFCVWNEALFYCQILFDTLKITERNTSNSVSVFGLIVCFWKINT